MTRESRTDPAVIRDVLAYPNTHSARDTAARFKVHPKSIWRWRRWRDESGGTWPTDADITEWRRKMMANGAARERRRAATARYRVRRYLNGGPVMVDATGTTRRLRALAALGHPHRVIAADMGVSRARVGHLAAGMFPVVWAATAESVTRTYDRLSMTPGPSVTTRNIAVRNGYAPPLAWDDDTIDDPAAKPEGVFMSARRRRRKSSNLDNCVVQRILDGEHVPNTTKAEKVAATAAWIASGRTQADLARLTGWKVERYTPRAVDGAA